MNGGPGAALVGFVRELWDGLFESQGERSKECAAAHLFGNRDTTRAASHDATNKTHVHPVLLPDQL